MYIFRTLKNDESRIMMTREMSEYKRTIRCARYEFDKQKTLRFEQAIVNTKLYWTMLKESANVKSSTTVNLDMFEKYFKAVNDPDDPFLDQMKMFYILMKDIYKVNYELCLVSVKFRNLQCKKFRKQYVSLN